MCVCVCDKRKQVKRKWSEYMPGEEKNNMLPKKKSHETLHIIYPLSFSLRIFSDAKK